jgi:predicted MFS family arabinose efflux permease
MTVTAAASEDTPLLPALAAVSVPPVALKSFRYDFADRDGMSSSHGMHTRSAFWFLNLGLLSCYVVCGLIIAALSASIQDIAANVGRQSTDIASVYVARGVGSVIGSFASAPIFDRNNAVQWLVYTYFATAAAMIWIPYIDSLMSLHIAYFVIGAVTSLISAGSILLLRKIHREHAGPWLGALGAALVSAGIIVPVVQMGVGPFRDQFFIYALLVMLGAVWLRLLPFIPEDIHTSASGELMASVAMQVTESTHSMLSVKSNRSNKSNTFFMTSVSAASGQSSSSLYCSIVGDRNMTNSSFSHSSQKRLCSHGSGIAHLDGGRGSRGRGGSLPDRMREFEDANPSDESHGSTPFIDIDDDDVDIEAEGGRHNMEQVVHVEVDFVSTGRDRGKDNDRGRDSEKEKDIYAEEDSESSQPDPPPHYWTDMLISLMVFFIVGGSTSFSIYLETYVDQTPIINTNLKAMALLVFFCSGTVANISGIFVQISISDRSLGRLTASVLAFGALGTLLVMGIKDSAAAIWTGIAIFGFSSAITVGFCFNIANRLSYPSATSTSIIMIGSSVGVSIIPYISSLLIAAYAPGMIMLVGLVSMVVPGVLLVFAIKCSYMPHTF